ncbi:DMT family transporter [Paenalcaligenes niemegkensis]|uniref:DMT family transporter n=1 Tax=Paenalcaligenes niemegkensis TaxID=2895469 RepID=UPI001EE7EE93|nr:DMT family transporter [Paenalcaligenes niemegkensis]MCQ9616976.1 DMT family transporter [Paenalcaligenes niemegkensis]
MQLSKKFSHLLLLVFVSLIASSTFAGIKIASSFFNAYEITFLRSSIAFLFFLPFLFFRKSWIGLNFHSWLSVFLISFVGVLLPFTLLNWAGKRIDSSLVGILWSTLPIFGVVLAHFLTKNDRLGANKILSVMLGIISVYLISFQNLGEKDVSSSLLPHLAVIFSAFCYAVSGILQKRLPQQITGLFLTATTMGISAIASYCIWSDQISFNVQANAGTAAVVYLGLVTSAILAYLRFILIRVAGYSLVSYTGYLVPVCSVFIGVVFLEEHLPSNAYAALVLAVIAILFSQIRFPPTKAVK